MRIALNTDNAAFSDEQLDREVAAILRTLADRIEHDGLPPARDSYALLDSNGNAVGVCTSTPVRDYSCPYEIQ